MLILLEKKTQSMHVYTTGEKNIQACMLTLLEIFFSPSMHAYTAGKKLKAYMLTLLQKKKKKSIHAYIDETNLKAYLLTLLEKKHMLTLLEKKPKKRAFNLHTHTATHTSNTQKSILKETAHKICTHPSQSQLSLPFSPSCHLDPSSS